MVVCDFCERDCDEDRDPFSEAADSFIHHRCLTWKVKRRKAYDACLHAIAREFGMAKAAAGRKALECRNGHAYTDENTYIDRKGYQQCRTCGRRAYRRYQERHEERYREMRRRSGKTLGIVVPVALRRQVMAAATAAGQPLSTFVRGLLLRELPAWEARFQTTCEEAECDDDECEAPTTIPRLPVD